MRLLRLSLFAFALAASGQQASPVVQVSGAVKQPLGLTLADLARMPRTTAKAVDHGTAITYEGVLLHEVLKRAGVPSGKEVHGKNVASYVLAEGRDGYRAVYALPELDPEFLDNGVLLADKANGGPLPEPQGPVRLVAPKEKRAARCVRMLSKLTVVQVGE